MQLIVYNKTVGEELVKKNKRKSYFFIIYKAITIDWLLIYAVDSIYYAEIKGMSFSMISLLTMVFCLSFAVAQIPCIKFVRWFGTANASRLGTILLFISTLFLFFDPWAMFVAQIFSGVGLSIKNLAEPKILKDNLKMYGLSDNFAKYGAISRFGFCFLTAVGTFAAGYLYEFWPYAPFVLASSILLIAVIMSFFIQNEKELYKKANNLPKHNVSIEKFEYIKLFKYRTTWLLLFLCLFYFALVCSPVDINKMVFQELNFTTTTITTITGIACMVRAFATLGFGYVYKKLKFNSIHILTAAIIIGLLMFETKFRRKEIGLRRVHGASIREILEMFNRKFFYILLISFLIAAPVGYIVMDYYYSTFAYRSPLHWWVFLLAFVMVAIITVGVVTLCSYKAASENPAETLKNE